MSFLGKIKSAVMGNPVTRECEIGRHMASTGPGLMWSQEVHQAGQKYSHSQRRLGECTVVQLAPLVSRL